MKKIYSSLIWNTLTSYTLTRYPYKLQLSVKIVEFFFLFASHIFMIKYNILFDQWIIIKTLLHWLFSTKASKVIKNRAHFRLNFYLELIQTLHNYYLDYLLKSWNRFQDLARVFWSYPVLYQKIWFLQCTIPISWCYIVADKKLFLYFTIKHSYWLALPIKSASPLCMADRIIRKMKIETSISLF